MLCSHTRLLHDIQAHHRDVHQCNSRVVADGQLHYVANYITKAESTPDGNDPALVAQLRVAAGLAYLENKKYKLAARKFLEVPAEHAAVFAEIASAQDVALYGGLCALASFDRTELKSKVVESSSFKAFLELFPQVRAATTTHPTPTPAG